MGGYNSGNLSSAELYDPATSKWRGTSGMTATRYRHTVTLLPSGKVLVAGGFSDSGIAMNHAALYDPVTEGWTTTGMMRHSRALHTATLLPSIIRRSKIILPRAGDAGCTAGKGEE